MRAKLRKAADSWFAVTESKMIRFSYQKREKEDWSRKQWQQEHELEYERRGTDRRWRLREIVDAGKWFRRVNRLFCERRMRIRRQKGAGTVQKFWRAAWQLVAAYQSPPRVTRMGRVTVAVIEETFWPDIVITEVNLVRLERLKGFFRSAEKA